jgi:hypothetical protein
MCPEAVECFTFEASALKVHRRTSTERARPSPSPFTRQEQAVAAAAAVCGRAYTARCFHASGGDVSVLQLPAYAAALLQ